MFFFGRARIIKGDFSNSKFQSGDFDGAEIMNGNFENAELRHVSFREVDLSNVIFYGAHLETAYLAEAKWKSRKYMLREEREVMFERLCSVCGAEVKDEKKCMSCEQQFIEGEIDKCPRCGLEWQAGYICPDCDFILARKEKSEHYRVGFKRAEGAYRAIKHSLQNEGDYDKAGEFYLRERIMNRKKMFAEKRYRGWLIDRIYGGICGYGERPLHVAGLTLIVVFFFSLFYYAFSAFTKHGEQSYSLSYAESIYLSIVTFTTLGYGDYSPKAEFQLVATFEAFLGVFLLALLVFTFGRKMMR